MNLCMLKNKYKCILISYLDIPYNPIKISKGIFFTYKYIVFMTNNFYLTIVIYNITIPREALIYFSFTQKLILILTNRVDINIHFSSMYLK